MNSYKVLFKYPSRSRPELFKSTLTNYLEFQSNKEDYQFVISSDNDDSTMNCDDIKEFVQAQKNCSIVFGNSKTKIEAVNADVPNTPWDICVLVSEDMLPIVRGFDTIIRNDFEKYFPDLDGLLWYYDGRQKNVCTLTVMGRKLYDELGNLYDPAFITHYPDDYLTLITRDKQQFIDKCIIRHDWRKHNSDALMDRNENPKYTSKDKRTYRRMERKWERENK